MIEQPVHVHLNATREVTRLFFRNSQAADFYVRAAVAWPEGTTPGIAIIGGQNITSNVVTVFDEYEFLSVDAIYRGDKKEYSGFIEFCRSCWLNYGCYSFYWNQSNDTHLRFARRTYRSPMVEPKPEFIKVPYTEITAANILREYAADQRVVMSRQGVLFERITQSGEGEWNPALHALKCLLSGLEFTPWLNIPASEDGAFVEVGATHFS